MKEKVMEETIMKETVKRCFWVDGKSEVYVNYHDNEWGIPVYDDEKLFEMLLLECFQAGLSWITILNKRESFRKAFDGFDRDAVAAYDEAKIEALMQDAGIIRNRRKITAAIQNAKVFGEIQKEFGSFSAYLWGFTGGNIVRNQDNEVRTTTELSDRVSADLKKRGMRFVGSVTVYSYLQAVGVVDDHELDCWKHSAE